MFKKILFVFSLFVFSYSADAQRFAVVDINKVLESLTDYQQAQSELDKVAAEWRQDIAKEYDEIKALYNKYQAEQVLLSDEVRRQREDEITNREREVREMQKQKFGPEGTLFKKRQDLVYPIQEKVYSAIEDFANDRGYDFILDKGGSSGILFVKPDHDKTDSVIKLLK